MAVKWYGKEVINKINTESIKIISKACFMVERDAKILQTPHVDTGRLRASISSNWTGSGLSRGKVTTPAKPEDGIEQPTKKLTGVVGSNVSYARRIELGFVGVDSLGRKYNQQPYPYLRPALHKNEKKILELFKNII
uniref:Tail protein n=1 Tax=viral metagenome TaxID=1070528 RepID=A0A6H1ZRR4_9ZZZZ